MRGSKNPNKFQIIWKLLEFNKEALDSYDCIIQNVNFDFGKLIVIGTKADIESLVSKRNFRPFVEYIKVEEAFIASEINEVLKNYQTDSVIMDSTVLLPPQIIDDCYKAAYSNRICAGIVPTEIFIRDKNDILPYSSVFGYHKCDEFEEIENPLKNLCRYHCLFLKKNFIDKFKWNEANIFSDEEEILNITGKIFLKCTTVYVGIMSTLHQHNLEMDMFHLIKKIRKNNEKKNLLYYLLADFQDDAWNHMGGTQLHVKDLTNGFSEEYNIVVMARDNEFIRVTYYCNQEKFVFKFFVGTVEKYQKFYDPKRAELLSQILTAFAIDIVHVHHMLWMTLDIFSEAEKLGIPIIYTAHDYYSICPVLTMVNMQESVCTETLSKEECTECLSCRKGISKDIKYIDLWREEFSYGLQKCEKIIAPSKSVRNALIRYYPLLEDKIQVINHGIVLPDKKNRKESGTIQGEKLRIAFIGDIGKNKGAELIYGLIKKGNPKKFEWYLIGGVADEKLYHLHQKNLKKHGWYRKEDLSFILKEYQIDIVCILSKVPETFSYTFSEAMACQIPLLVTDIGALGERIQEYNVGWKVSNHARYMDVLELLESIIDNPKEYEEKWETLSNLKNISIEDMLNEYRKLYERYPKIKIHGNINWINIIKSYEENENNDIVLNNSEEESSKDENRQAEVINPLENKIAKKYLLNNIFCWIEKKKRKR